MIEKNMWIIIHWLDQIRVPIAKIDDTDFVLVSNKKP